MSGGGAVHEPHAGVSASVYVNSRMGVLFSDRAHSAVTHVKTNAQPLLQSRLRDRLGRRQRVGHVDERHAGLVLLELCSDLLAHPAL